MSDHDPDCKVCRAQQALREAGRQRAAMGRPTLTGDDASREAAKRMSVRGPSPTNDDGFHACDGLFFVRLQNGDVRVRLRETRWDHSVEAPRAFDRDVVIPSAVWGSVVAFVR